MDIKKCDFCLKDFGLARDPIKGFNEMKYENASGSYILDDTNRLNRFIVTKKCFLTDKEKEVDICDNCLNKLSVKYTSCLDVIIGKIILNVIKIIQQII